MTTASRTVDHVSHGVEDARGSQCVEGARGSQGVDADHPAVNRPLPRLTRGTAPTARTSVALLTGRHETSKRFESLAIRLAMDGHAVAIAKPGGDTTTALGEFRNPDVPFILLGSDTGALRALTLAGSPALRADALILLGLPLLQRPVSGEPLTEPPPRALPDMPILLIHGHDDRISPLPLIRMLTRTAPRAELAVVPGGHGVLHDDGHRWAAARILLFLEALIHDRSAHVPGARRP